MTKIFAHRGYVTGTIAENSIASLDNAVNHGFKAVEFDIWFINDRLVVNHDQPQPDAINHLPQLRDFFKFGNDLDYWLDFKNMTQDNISDILPVLSHAIQTTQINLSQIYFVPGTIDYPHATTIYQKLAATFGDEAILAAFCKNESNLNDLKTLLNTDQNITCISVFHELINPDFLQTFCDRTILAWTIDDVERIHALQKVGIDFFVSNRITPSLLSP